MPVNSTRPRKRPARVSATAASVPSTVAAAADRKAMLSDIQAAHSQGDLAKMRGLATPEMLGYFSEQLSANSSRFVNSAKSPNR